MKTKHLLAAIAILLSCHCLNAATAPKREFRATWLTTHYAIDWPKTKVSSGSTAQINAQKAELTAIMDELLANNMNAFCLQVRPTADAYYKSSYEPYGIYLTGTRGKNPGYDPLAFAVEEAHKRGLEIHAWINPFRVTAKGELATTDPVWKNCKDWIIKYDQSSFSGQIIDPGYPQGRAYVVKVLMEIVNNYDIDGMLMDDYFYPYCGTTDEDAASKAAYKPASMTDAAWRRDNVNKAIRALYDSIQTVKPWVRLGIGPFGIWSTDASAARSYGISLPTGVRGTDAYDKLGCDAVAWIKGGYIDYIAPQLYWSTQVAAQDYDVLCQWWAQSVCKHFSDQLPGKQRVDFFSAQAAYHAYPETDGSYYNGYEDGVLEILRQLNANRLNAINGVSGSIFYQTTAYRKMAAQIKGSHFTQRALPPAMDWKATATLATPTNLTLSDHTLTWSHPSAERFTVYAFPKGTNTDDALSSSQYLLGVVYGKSYTVSTITDLSGYTLAVCAYDRYGVEYAPALYNEGTTTPDITWELNGGTVSVPVPTNAELWEAFMPYYNTYYAGRQYIPRSTQPITNVSTFANAYMQEIMTDDNSEYKWLGDYILVTAAEQGYTLDSESAWRWAVHAFFNCSPANSLKIAAPDFTTAGQPSAWGGFYQLAHGGAVLPSSVTETYTLPTPTKEGATFLGWYDNPQFTGSPLTTIPAGYTGTLYARWQDASTAIETIDQADSYVDIRIYDTMGRYLGTDINQLGHGVYILVSGNTATKVIR